MKRKLDCNFLPGYVKPSINKLQKKPEKVPCYRLLKFFFPYRKKVAQSVTSPFKRQPHKMVKFTQTIRRQIAGELFECVRAFCVISA